MRFDKRKRRVPFTKKTAFVSIMTLLIMFLVGLVAYSIFYTGAEDFFQISIFQVLIIANIFIVVILAYSFVAHMQTVGNEDNMRKVMRFLDLLNELNACLESDFMDDTIKVREDMRRLHRLVMQIKYAREYIRFPDRAEALSEELSIVLSKFFEILEKPNVAEERGLRGDFESLKYDIVKLIDSIQVSLLFEA